MVPRRYVHVREPSGAVGTVTRARDHRRGRTRGQAGQNPDITCSSSSVGYSACHSMGTALLQPFLKPGRVGPDGCASLSLQVQPFRLI
eukprot:scaffold3581_cov58-Phaeocystis_antarctica.AAC.3